MYNISHLVITRVGYKGWIWVIFVSVFNCSHFTFMIRIRVFAKLYSYVSHLYVSCSESITSVVGKELICWLSFTCNYLVSVRRDFLFLLVLGLGCVILLWHSLGIPYNYFVGYVRLILGQIIEIKQRRMLCKIVPQTQTFSKWHTFMVIITLTKDPIQVSFLSNI